MVLPCQDISSSYVRVMKIANSVNCYDSIRVFSKVTDRKSSSEPPLSLFFFNFCMGAFSKGSLFEGGFKNCVGSWSYTS